MQLVSTYSITLYTALNEEDYQSILQSKYDKYVKAFEFPIKDFAETSNLYALSYNPINMLDSLLPDGYDKIYEYLKTCTFDSLHDVIMYYVMNNNLYTGIRVVEDTSEKYLGEKKHYVGDKQYLAYFINPNAIDFIKPYKNQV